MVGDDALPREGAVEPSLQEPRAPLRVDAEVEQAVVAAAEGLVAAAGRRPDRSVIGSAWSTIHAVLAVLAASRRPDVPSPTTLS